MDNLYSSTVGGGVQAIVEYDYTPKEPDELTLVKGTTIYNIKVKAGGWWEGTIAPGKTGMFPDNFVKVLEPDELNPVVLRVKTATVNRRCKAVYSYTQNNNDELTLAVGDVIEFLGEVEEGWWRGKLGSNVGVFPSNFVVMENHSPVLANRRIPSVTLGTTNVAAASTTGSININNHLHHMNNSLAVSATTQAQAAMAAAAAAAIAKQKSSSREDLVSTTINNINNTTVIINQTSTANAISHNSLLAALEKDAPILPPKPVREQCKVMYPYQPANEDELELKEGETITILSRELPDKGWWKGELRGKVGVFPDNFVTLISPEPSPTKDSSHKPERPPTSSTSSTTSISSSKLLMNNNTSSTINTSNNKITKDSFGSKDSLNDTSIITTGNVAAYRKSLENKGLDVTGGIGGGGGVGGIDKPVRKSFDKPPVSGLNDFRKSIENLDEKSSLTINNKTSLAASTASAAASAAAAAQAAAAAPPVLSKKPNIPVKKSPTVGSVAGNLFSGLKQKVNKNSEKNQSTDNLDGLGGSKVMVADNGDRSIIGERIRKDSSSGSGGGMDFDQIERGGSILQDMRAGRVKAPKRRLPTSAMGSSSGSLDISDPTTNTTTSTTTSTTYQNGGGGNNTAGSGPYPSLSSSSGGSLDLLEQSLDDDDVAKPKPRNWEKQKAPWMDELKASQAKKTSPNMEAKSPASVASDNIQHQSESEKFDMSKSFNSSYSSISNNNSMNQSSSSHVIHHQQHKKIAEINNFEIRSNSVDVKGISGMSSASVSSSGSSILETMHRKEHCNSMDSSSMIRSMSSISGSGTNTSATAAAAAAAATRISFNPISNSSMSETSNDENSIKIRPTSVNLRNRSISPIGRIAMGGAAGVGVGGSKSVYITASTSTTNNNNSVSHNNSDLPPTGLSAAISSSAGGGLTITTDNVCSRVQELESKVLKLEKLVQVQNATIEELLKSVRDESDKVKSLKGELDKYAQCVTQV